MPIDEGSIREFRLLLRQFFDAQFEDWGEEANEPRFAEIERFLLLHIEERAELVEIFLCAFWDLNGGIAEILERLGSELDPGRVTMEIDAYAARRPRV